MANNNFATQGVSGNTPYYGGLGIDSSEYLGKLKGPGGMAIYEQMRRSDPQIGAVLDALGLPIRQASYYIDPVSDKTLDREIADKIGKNLFSEMSILWDDVIRHALLMLPFGFSILEKIFYYDEKNKMVKIKKPFKSGGI